MNELMIPLQSHSDKALYEQIYEYICKDIVDGKISCGERLPSTRLLARHLQVSRSTVELAYAQLVSEGYIGSRPYRGYYVSDITDLYQKNQRQRDKRTELEAVQEKEDKIEIDFNPYQADLANFPYHAWKKAQRKVWEDPIDSVSHSDRQGELQLRQEICRYLHQARGVVCEPSQMIIGAGNEYLLLLLAQILGKEQRVVMESLTHIQAYRIFRNMGYEILAAEMDADGLSMRSVEESDADLAFVMPSHQFPLGVVMSMKRRLELLKWARKREGRYLIEDDHDSEFRYKGKPIPALQGMNGGDRVIYMGTFSKSLASAIRVGYMVLPKSLCQRYQEYCGFYAATVSKNQQEVLYHFMQAGNFERHLNRMRGIYKAKHDYLTNLLKKESWVRSIQGDNAGLHVLVEVDTDMGEEELIRALQKKQIRVYGLCAYRISEQKEQKSEPILLLGYGDLTEEQMKCGIEQIRQTLQE